MDETPSDKKIRENIQKSIATKIQEYTMLLRRQQKGLLDRLRNLNTSNANDNLNFEMPEFDEEERAMDMV